jgi:hypothetical protein
MFRHDEKEMETGLFVNFNGPLSMFIISREVLLKISNCDNFVPLYYFNLQLLRSKYYVYLHFNLTERK